MWISQKVYICVFYFSSPASTVLPVSIRTMCASADVFTLVTTSTDDINSKASPVLKPQPDKIPDVTKGKKTLLHRRKSIGVGGKRTASGRNYSYAAWPWMNGAINCTGKASTGTVCSVLVSQYEMNGNKLEREQQSTAKMVRGLKHMAKKRAAEGL